MLWVIFGEGKNDTYFIGEVFRHQSYSLYEREFNAEEIDTESLIPQESEVIRSFIRMRRGEQAILLKSEQGSQLLRVVSNFLFDLAGENVIFGLIIDLDGDSLHDMIEELNREVQQRSQRSVKIVKDDLMTSNNDFHTIRCQALQGDRLLDSFGIIAFREDLEAAVGLDGSECRENREQEIRRYVNENPSYARQAVEVLI